MNRKFKTAFRAARRGVITIKAAMLLLALMGIVACAFDIGWMAMTKTQLQAAADSAALAGGTQLMPGLGFRPTQTSSQVFYNSGMMAVDFASRNPNGDVSNSYANYFQDISLGNTYFDPSIGQFRKSWGQTPYNMVRVTLHRDRDSGDDGKLRLFFGAVLGHDTIGLQVRATAAIMPAGGIRIAPGSSQLANIMPFTIHTSEWGRYQRAQTHYNNVLNSNPNSINSSYWDSTTQRPLYFDYTSSNSGSGNGGGTELRQTYFDNLRFNASDGKVLSGSDGALEIDAYPRARIAPLGGNTSGNSGTIDFGDPSNSTSDLERQIRYGLNASDLAYYNNSEINISSSTPFYAEADTGISSGMEAALNDVAGQTRVIALFDQLVNPGNTAEYRLIGLAGVRVMKSKLSGSTSSKYMYLQLAPTVLSGGVADMNSQVTGSTTVFTPLILIE